MAEIHYRTVEKKTFNPNKNYFEIEHIKLYREETEEETALNNNITLCYNSELLVQIFGPCGATVALIILICSNLWIYGLISFVVLLALSIIIGHNLSKEGDKYSRELYEFYDKQVSHFWAEATAEILAHNAEQERIAEEWRAKHPFEEKIRAVLNDPMSSVDVAEMAYFFADKYLKEKLGD